MRPATFCFQVRSGVADIAVAVPEIKNAVPGSKELRTSEQANTVPGIKFTVPGINSEFCMSREFSSLRVTNGSLTVLDKFLMLFTSTTCTPREGSCILNTVRRPKTQAVVVVPPTEQSIEPKEFVKIEKNLNTLGFFTPAKHRGAKSSEKVVYFRRELNGKTHRGPSDDPAVREVRVAHYRRSRQVPGVPQTAGAEAQSGR